MKTTAVVFIRKPEQQQRQTVMDDVAGKYCDFVHHIFTTMIIDEMIKV